MTKHSADGIPSSLRHAWINLKMAILDFLLSDAAAFGPSISRGFSGCRAL